MYRNRVHQQMRRALYSLVKDYGEPIEWVVRNQTTQDYNTGEQLHDESKYRIHRAIVQPIRHLSQPKYTFTYLAANNNFVYDGAVKKEDLGIVVNIRDVPFIEKTKTHLDDYIILQTGDKFEIENISEFVQAVSYLIKLKGV